MEPGNFAISALGGYVLHAEFVSRLGQEGWCTFLVASILGTNVLYILVTVGRCCREFYKRNEKNISGVVKAVKGVTAKGRGSVMDALGRSSGLGKDERKSRSSRPEPLPAVAIVNVKPPGEDGSVEMVQHQEYQETPARERRNTSVTL